MKHSVESLNIQFQICPPWLMKSGAVLGRCMPFFPSNATSDTDTIFDIDDLDSTTEANKTVTLGVRENQIFFSASIWYTDFPRNSQGLRRSSQI